MLAGLGLGIASMGAPRLLGARETDAFSTYGIVPGGGEIDQTAMLQRAADAAAQSDTPLSLPAGIYSTRRLTLKSGTRIVGVPGRTILRARGGGSIIKVKSADNVRLSGLILDGDSQWLDTDGALLVADDVSGLEIRECRLIGSSEDGIVLQCVSGHIAGCTMSRIGGTALSSIQCSDLAIMDNTIEHASTGLSLTGAPDSPSVVAKGNVIHDLFLRKMLPHSGVGIVVDCGAVIRGNVIDGAPAYGIRIAGDRQHVRVTGNSIRNAFIDIVSINESLFRSGGEA
ncbi:MAG: right-handed parallel beta-helix repeat-containing protein [Methyloceanibacter sp.]